MKIRKLMKKSEFMKKYNIAIPEPMPTKPVLLRLIREANVWKQYTLIKLPKLQAVQFSGYHLITVC